MIEYELIKHISINSGVQSIVSRRIVTLESNIYGMNEETGDDIVVSPFSYNESEMSISFLFPVSCKIGVFRGLFTTLGALGHYDSFTRFVKYHGFAYDKTNAESDYRERYADYPINNSRWSPGLQAGLGYTFGRYAIDCQYTVTRLTDLPFHYAGVGVSYMIAQHGSKQ